MKKRIPLILSLFSIMLFNFVVNSPISYAETIRDDMPIEIELIGSHKPEVDPEFIIYIEADDVSYPMPDGTVNGIYEIKIMGEGKVSFPKIDFDRIGDYSYTIYQDIDSDNESYDYDGTVYILFVTVTLNEETQDFDITYNAYRQGEEDKSDRILFVNEYVQDTLGDFVEPEPKPEPKPPKGGLPLTGSVDVYYMLGFASIMVGVLITALKKARE